jgi:hypothetical protein
VANAGVAHVGLVLNKVHTSADGYYRSYDYYGTEEKASKLGWMERLKRETESVRSSEKVGS